MPNINLVVLAGHVCFDVDLRYTVSGIGVVRNTLGVNTYRTDKNGNLQKKSVFVPFSLFGKLADNFAKYVKKGDPLILIGELEQEEWEVDGKRRNRLALRVSSMQFFSKNGTNHVTSEEEHQQDDSSSDIPF